MSSLVVVRDTRLKDLLVYWEAKRRGRPMPEAGELSPDLGFILPNMLWVEIEHEPRRYRYRRVGTELERIYGSSVEGMYIDEMPGFMYRRVASRAYAEVYRIAAFAEACRKGEEDFGRRLQGASDSRPTPIAALLRRPDPSAAPGKQSAPADKSTGARGG